MIVTLKKASHGFSLIELMVVVIIIAILAAVGYPMYRGHVLKSRRADAKSALVQLTQLQENYYTNNSNYATTFTALNKSFNEFEIIDDTTLKSAEGYYLITLSGGNTFTLTAKPTEEGGQNEDSCTQFTIDSVGRKLPDECW
ncbi:MAG: type IV pilin protein [Thioploca sp.]|nr:type IV pilin protein [Thioploca sp.]